MGNLKYRLEPFLYYDGEGIARHLERMAARGWRLEKTGALFWRYRRAEPARVRYAVTYFPRASEFNPYPPPSQEEFYDYCRAAGWALVTERGQMQIFSAARENPVPIETDEAARVRVIHRVMLRSYMPSNLLLLLLAVFQLFFQIRSILRDPVGELSRWGAPLLVLAWLLIGLSALLTIGGYLVWYLRARKAAEAGGRLEGTEQWFRWLTAAVCGSGLASLVPSILSIFLSGAVRVSLLWFAGLVVIMAVVAGVKNGMKRHGVPGRKNRNITMAVTTALSLLFAATVPLTVLYILRSGGTGESRTDGRAEMPLVLEDLGTPESEDFICTWERQSSPLVTYGQARQRGEPGSGLPHLEYEVSDVHFPALFDLCLDGYLNRYDDAYSRLTGRHFCPLNDPAWDAEVWQVWDDEGPWPYYLACKDGRIVWLMADDFLTPEQTKTASEKLFGGTI